MIGPGVAVDPFVLRDEMALLPDSAKKKLVVDGRCGLVSPLEKAFDRKLEEARGSSAIGTTMRGIGPSYAMRALRLSPRIHDLLRGFDFKPLLTFYGNFGLDDASLASWEKEAIALLRPLTGDVSERVTGICDKGGRVLFEASQGTLLDLLHGTYPYVTSTHTTVTYIPASIGVAASYNGEPLGVMKCYSTRVGGGPFPTEESGPVAERIRSIGSEYGATTGRPRRIGWLDMVALKYALKLNGVKELAVSKVDVLSRVDEFKVCVAYEIGGSEVRDFQRSLPDLAEAKPVYESPFSMRGADFSDGLPPQGKLLVDYLEKELKVRVILVSHGEERSKTIELTEFGGSNN